MTDVHQLTASFSFCIATDPMTRHHHETEENAVEPEPCQGVAPPPSLGSLRTWNIEGTHGHAQQCSDGVGTGNVTECVRNGRERLFCYFCIFLLIIYPFLI